MTQPLGSIVASLGIDRSRWDDDVRRVKNDVNHVQRLFANLGNFMAQRDFSRAVGARMSGGSQMPDAIQARYTDMFNRQVNLQRVRNRQEREFLDLLAEGVAMENAQNATNARIQQERRTRTVAFANARAREVQLEREFVSLLGAAVAESNQLADAQHRTASILTQARTPLQGLYGDFRRLKMEAHGVEVAVDSMAAAMSRANNASQRMAAGMANASAQWKLQAARQGLTGPSQADRQFNQFVSGVLVDERNAARAAQGMRPLGGGGVTQQALAYEAAIRRISQAHKDNAVSTARNSYAILELGRAIEDAAIGYQINGWSGAFRGAANNIGVLLMTMGQWPMLLFATGIAAATAWPHLDRLINGTEEAKDVLDRYTDSIQKNIEAQARRRAILGLDASSAAQSETQRLQEQIALLEDEERLLNEGNRINRTERPWWAEYDITRAVGVSIGMDPRDPQQAMHNQRMAEIDAERADLQRQLEMAQKRTLELRERERLEAERLLAIEEQRKQIAARQQAVEEARNILDPIGAERRAMQQRHADRSNAIFNDTSISEREQLQLNALSIQAWQRERAALDLRLFEEENGGLLNGRPQHFATTLESGSQEAFRAIAEARKTQQDPLRELTGISDAQLTQLRMIHRELQRRAEAEVNAGEVDL